MNNEQKKQIIDAAKAYQGIHEMSNAQLAKACKVNPTHLSFMLNYQFSIEHKKSGSKPTVIADKYFTQLSTYVGFTLQKKYWEVFEKPQYQQTLEALEDAKFKGAYRMVIGESGCGKTYTKDLFIQRHPLYTYCVTVNSLFTVKDVIVELAEAMKVVERKSVSGQMNAIVKHLVDLRSSGKQPLVILDEGENMKLHTIQMIKGLYDKIRNHCGVVIIGTPQLLTKLNKLNKKDACGVPQFLRRFRAGMTMLDPIEKDFGDMLEKYVQDKGLRKLLYEKCDNYGELYDYLEPAMREADERGEPLTEGFFRIKYNMPKMEYTKRE